MWGHGLDLRREPAIDPKSRLAKTGSLGLRLGPREMSKQTNGQTPAKMKKGRKKAKLPPPQKKKNKKHLERLKRLENQNA